MYDWHILAKAMKDNIVEYLKNPENMEKFKQWYRKEYGVDYDEKKDR